MKNKKKDLYILVGIAYAIILYLILHYCHVSYGNDAGMIERLTLAMSEAASKPFAIFNAFKDIGRLFMTILIVTAALAFAIMYFISEEEKRAHYKSDEVKGTSRWNTDFKGFKKKYTVVKKGNKYLDAVPNKEVLK